MSQDIGPIISGWEYAPGELRVRVVGGADGRRRIQLRMDLGVMQLEWTGRPDGRRPHDFVSFLDYYTAQRHRDGTADESFVLSRTDCAELSREAMQYYWRRLSFFELHEYGLAEQDAEHNLQILDLCEQCAGHEADRRIAEHHRTFVMAHRVQARALGLLDQQEHGRALDEISSGIQDITRMLEERGALDQASECAELRFLEEWRKEVEDSRPLSPREELSRDLQRAVAREQYELAATLRDRLHRLETGQVGDPRPS